MPIYEYRCENGHTFEKLQRMVDDALKTCEVCDAPAQRVLHAPAIHFRGSGFYNTDYGTKKRARELKSAGSGEGKANGDGAKSGDAKTADSGSSSSSSSSDSGSSSASKPSSEKSSGSGGDKAPKSKAS